MLHDEWEWNPNMPRKRSASAHGVQPPQLPADLPLPDAPIVLDGDTNLHAVTLHDADLTGSQATDLLFDQVVLRQVRLT